jgi:predicted small lipoprotein YifL
MKATTPFLMLIGLLALTGCGILPPPYVHDNSKVDPDYTTGSNFGRRSPASSSMTKMVNKEDVEREAQALSARQANTSAGRSN